MQITNADIIKNGEQDLIDAITADLDWGAIENIFREQHNLGIDEDVEYKQGDIIVHDNQIAYQLRFEVKVTVSVLLDREGNYLSVSFSGNNENNQDKTAESMTAEKDEGADEEKEDLQGSTEKENILQDIEKEAKTSGEDIEELEALSENEKFDESEIVDTEDIEEETEKTDMDAEQKEIEEPHPINHETKVVEKIYDQNNEDSDQKISRIASQVSEIMEELGEEISA